MTTSPAPDELEVTLFGPGYGECVVVHLGGGDWLVVDSCRSSQSTESDALSYLERIGVDVATAVQRIIISHWHDDHIRGVSKLVARARSARVCCSAAMRSKEFGEAFEVADELAERGEPLPTSELASVFACLRHRASHHHKASAGPAWLVAGKCLYRREADATRPAAEVTVLSPSDGTLTRAYGELARVIRGEEPMSAAANDTAVVLHIQVGDQVALLGSDLETRTDPSQGWRAVVASTERPTGRAGIYKVAHHGSMTGEHEPTWTELCIDQPLAVVSPFMLGRVILPTAEDLQRIGGRASRTFMTSPPKWDKARGMAPAVKKVLDDVARGVRVRSGRYGMVQLRASVRGVAVALDGAAYEWKAMAS